MSDKPPDKELSEGNLINRENYKTIKRMNREELSAYLARVWSRGYMSGYVKCSEDKDNGVDVIKPKE